MNRDPQADEPPPPSRDEHGRQPDSSVGDSDLILVGTPAGPRWLTPKEFAALAALPSAPPDVRQIVDGAGTTDEVLHRLRDAGLL